MNALGASTALRNGRTGLKTAPSAERRTLVWAAAGVLLLVSAGADDGLEQRRARVAAMTAEEKAALQTRWDRYQRLSPAERQRIAQLHAAIQADPQAERLQSVMRRYVEWLGKQPPYVRGQLVEMPVAERVRALRKLAADVSPEDRRKAVEWLDQQVAALESKAVQAIPGERRQFLARMPAEQRRRFWVLMLLERSRHGDLAKIFPIDPTALAELRGRLSPEGRRRLENEPAEDQLEIVFHWIRTEFGWQWGRGRGLPQVDEDRLIEFFEKEVTPEQRDYLLNLSGEEMQRELRKMYFARMRPSGSMFDPEQSGHGKRPPGPPRGDAPSRPGDSSGRMGDGLPRGDGRGGNGDPRSDGRSGPADPLRSGGRPEGRGSPHGPLGSGGRPEGSAAAPVIQPTPFPSAAPPGRLERLREKPENGWPEASRPSSVQGPAPSDDRGSLPRR